MKPIACFSVERRRDRFISGWKVSRCIAKGQYQGYPSKRMQHAWGFLCCKFNDTE